MPHVTRHPLADPRGLPVHAPIDAEFLRRTRGSIALLNARPTELGAAFLAELDREGWRPDPTSRDRPAGVGALLAAHLARAVARGDGPGRERALARIERTLERWFDARGPSASVLRAAAAAVAATAPELDLDALDDWSWTVAVVTRELDARRALRPAGPGAPRAMHAPRATPPRSCSWRGPPPPPPRPR